MTFYLKIILCLVFAYAGTAFVVPLLLPVLRRLHAGQSIREEGPEAHKAKDGTPTMGGLSFIFIISLVSFIMWGFNITTIVLVATMLLFGLIGFIDDYIKVVKKQNLGLTAIQKIVLQLAFALFITYFAGRNGTEVYIPFVCNYVDFGWFFYPFGIFVVLAMSNAVNLTDGLDGLASSVTVAVSMLFAVVCYGTMQNEVSGFAAAVCGGCMGFLLYNRHPAKLFMGDTGSMALGGALAAAAMMSRFEFLLPIAGGIYVAEALSVIIQVFVFKTQNGRRFFRMAPLHHHFELGGWSEVKVVKVFTVITAILCVIAFIGVLR